MLLTWGSSQGLNTYTNYVSSLSPAAWFKYGAGITVAGSGVSVWADQSGNGRDLLQGTDTNRPALQADSSILFDGVDNFLKCGAFTLNQPETVYILFRSVTWTLNDVVYDGNTAGSMYLYQSATTPDLRVFAGSALVPNSNLAVNTYGVHCGVYNGVSSVSQINNTTAITGNAGAANAGGFTLGADGGLVSGFSNIQVKEVIIYPTAHDATTRANVIRYLSAIGGV